MMAKSRKAVIEARTARLESLGSADSGRVATGMRRNLPRLRHGSWLDSTNEFLTSAPGTLSNKSDDELSALADDLDDYVAASSLLHCTDSWSYLGRAFNCVCAGLLDEAVHLAYYSEVRSALALLAANGVLVSEKTSHALLGSGKVRSIRQGSTHDLVWALLDEWSTTTPGINAVSSVVRAEGVALGQWLAEQSRGVAAGGAVASLTKLWGLDLSTFAEDRTRRNIASYNPSGLHLASNSGTAEWARDLVVEAAFLIEPKTPGSFATLDTALVAQALRARSQSDAQDFRLELGSVAKRVKGSDWEAERVAGILASYTEQPRKLLDAAITSSSPGYPVQRADVEGMLGRALILARLATGSVHHAVRVGVMDLGAMAPWADWLGVRLGYWDNAGRPDPLVELWTDLSDAAEDLQSVDFSSSVGPKVLFDDAAPGLIQATGLTRAALWSLSS